MLKTLDLKTPLLFSHSSLRISASLHSPNLASHLCQTPIALARRGRRRTTQARPESSARLLLNLASLAASNLKLLPGPLNFVLEEIVAAGSGGPGAGGGRGNQGSWNAFGWGDFGGFGRRRAKRKSNLWLYGIAAICGLGFVLGREVEGNAVWWGLGFGPLGLAMVRWLERSGGVRGWVFLGFCLWSFVVGMSFRREELHKWISRVRVSLPMAGNLRGRAKRKRRSVF